MKKFTLSLRIWHPTLSSSDLIKYMGINAEILVNQSVGEPKITKSGVIQKGVYKKTYICWGLKEKTDGDFTDGVDEFLPLLKKHADKFIEISKKGGSCEIYVWIHPEGEVNLGFTIPKSTSKALGELGLDLSVELYIFDD